VDVSEVRVDNVPSLGLFGSLLPVSYFRSTECCRFSCCRV